MPKVCIVVGSYYGGLNFENLRYVLERQPLPDYAILTNHQLGNDRKPTGFAAIYNALLNAAFQDPNCEMAWVMGDDICPMDDCLSKTMERFLDPTIGVIFPVEAWKRPLQPSETEDKLITRKSKPLVTIIPFTNQERPILDAIQEGEEDIEQVFAGFACALIRREAWQAVGPMDESIGIGYCEDADWGLRCWKAGFRVVNYRRAWFWHERGATYNRFVQDGLMTKEAPYEAAERLKLKWPFMWRDSAEEIMARLRQWYAGAIR